MRSIFAKSQKGMRAFSLPKSSPAFDAILPPETTRQTAIPLPELSELEITRHFSRLAHKNMCIDTHFYPLGSCTMKLNPRVNEQVASMPLFTRTHPLAPQNMVEGNLRVQKELLSWLCDICGMCDGSLAPNAGAQGEYAGVLMIRDYHRANGDTNRDEMLIPDNAHGTNPASAAMAGFKTVTVKSDEGGTLDIEDLQAKLSEKTAGLMLTNPNTLGLVSAQILAVSKLVHGAGGLLYYDGANLNPIMQVARPGDMGFDVVHLNLHKTFSTPHGGGGPGSGPVLVNKRLQPYLDKAKLSSFHGNFGMWLRAYTYIRLNGKAGLRRVAEMAVLNANYVKKRLESAYHIPFKRHCMHEFVAQAKNALHVAKRLPDYGFHAPTIYFPLIVPECMLIEPTETESKETLDAFCDAMIAIANEPEELLAKAPMTTQIRRLDETQAARQPVLTDPLINSTN